MCFLYADYGYYRWLHTAERTILAIMGNFLFISYREIVRWITFDKIVQSIIGKGRRCGLAASKQLHLHTQSLS